ncbi:RNA polymerase sigma factor [bacterium]|nr:RNA polymerase sigma factor [bacterium]
MSVQAENIIVERCRCRDMGAFRTLVDMYRKQAYGFAFSYLRNADDALNVSQDAFVRAWKAIDTFEKGRSFRPWFFSIIKNLSLNLIEKRKSLREISIDKAMEDSGFDIADDSSDPHDMLEKSETQQQVWKAIMELKNEFREVIVLKHFHDLSYREIADTIGIPEGTVMSRLYHARLALKERLEAVR